MPPSSPPVSVHCPAMESLKKHDSPLGDTPVLSIDHKLAQEIEVEEDAPAGVKTVEAAERVYGKYSKWFLFIGCVFLLL